MSDFKFECIHCGQRLQCDEQFAGRQIACPSCKQNVIVPPAGGKATPYPAKTGMTFVPESWRSKQQAPPTPPGPTPAGGE